MTRSPRWQVRAWQAIALALALASLTAGPVFGQTAETSPVVATQGPTSPDPTVWKLVALGDSIAQANCVGCRSFVQRYADAITAATGVHVDVDNRAMVKLSNLPAMQASQLLHDILTDVALREAIASADIVLVNVGHNDTPWGRLDNPCDASDTTATVVDWCYTFGRSTLYWCKEYSTG